MLPPWYRLSNSQPQQQSAVVGASAGHNPPTPWGGSSNGSNASNTGYSQPPPTDSNWRSNSPSMYQRPHTPGRGNSSSWGSGNSSASGDAGAAGNSYGVQRQFSGGRGYGGYGGYRGGRGRGGSSPSPNKRASGPPVWVKHGCWLEPKPGSVDAAAYAAAVARHKQQLKQAQQQTPASASILAAAAVATSAQATAVASTATAAVVVTAPANSSGVIDLTGDDADTAASTGAATAAAAAAAAVSPSKADVIDLSGQTALPSPTTAVAGQLSGLQLLLQQHRSQQQQQQSLQAPPRVVHIMRGLPGSGKSTNAAQIAAEARAASSSSSSNSSSSSSSSSANPVAVHSTDIYFVDPSTGVYRFDIERLSTNHDKNFNAFCESLRAGVGTVVVDNTNIQPWQYEKYVQQAWAAGYRVREEVVGEFTPAALSLYAQRNVHEVPLDKLQMMLDQWNNQ